MCSVSSSLYTLYGRKVLKEERLLERMTISTGTCTSNGYLLQVLEERVSRI